VVDAAGNLYGTSNGAGLANGTVFELVHSSKGWTAKTIYTFAAEQPENLAIDAAGRLYGILWTDQGSAGIFQLIRVRGGNGRRIRYAAVAHRWGFQASTRAAIYSSVLRARYSSWCESKTGR
jgi:hypothetical protein